MYFYLGDTLIAKKLLEELTINYPGLNRSWLLFGNIMESEGDEIFAEVCYQKAFRLDPFDRQVLYTLGKYYDLHGDTTKVAVYFKRLQAIERFPRMTDYAIRTARIYQMQIFYNAYYPSLLQPYITASNPDIPERYIKEK